MEKQQHVDDGFVCRSYGIELRSLNETARSIEVVASTETIDSYGEIVAQNWKLDRYRSNPVVLFAHRSRELAVGRAENVRVENGALCATFVFATAEANPLAEQVWQSIRQKMLRGVSVGFMPSEIRYEKRDGKDVCVLDQNELFEISMTPVPANPEGLAKAKALALKQQQAGTAPSHEKDTHMDPEKLKLELETAQRAAKTLEERVKSLELDVKALEARASAAERSRDEAVTRANKLDEEAVAAGIEAIIGTKIGPDQKTEFTELRSEMGREKFSKFIAKFPDLNLTKEKTKDEGSRSVENTATKSGKPSKLLAKANEVARRAGGDV